MIPFQKWRNSRGQPMEAAAFQWEYTPVESDGDSPYELLSDRDDTMDDGPSGTPAWGTAEFSGKRSRSAKAISASGVAPSPPLSADDDSMVGMTAALVPTADSAQTRYLRHSLDTALDHWRAYDEPPSAALTRRGLDALVDGTELSPDQRSLLLRAALYHGSGVLTALQFQDDAELTAIVIAEALTTSRRPLVPEAVIIMRDRDAQGDIWFGPLMHELRYVAAGSDVRIRRRAVDALWRLQGEYAAAPVAREAPVGVPAGGRSSRAEQTSNSERSRRNNVVLGMLITMAVVAAVVSMWYLSRDSDLLVTLPAGQYLLPRDGTVRRVATTGFEIQRFEVTNQDYRACVTSGRCSPPGASALSGIGAYFDDRAYKNHPVVNVTYAQAAEYCAAHGMRLPSAAEWTLAAGAAPTTGDLLAYPWGNSHEVQRANTLESGLAGPTEVGSFSSAGDSPIGAADMGGNVAEWTMTTGDGGITRVVKGGSFRQSADAARVESQDEIAVNGIGDWIGFRCLRATTSE